MLMHVDDKVYYKTRYPLTWAFTPLWQGMPDEIKEFLLRRKVLTPFVVTQISMACDVQVVFEGKHCKAIFDPQQESFHCVIGNHRFYEMTWCPSDYVRKCLRPIKQGMPLFIPAKEVVRRARAERKPGVWSLLYDLPQHVVDTIAKDLSGWVLY